MPYPTQVTPERILDTARALIASDGAAALSLGRLAAELGIKPPSLYRYFASKEALIRALNEQTSADLFAAMATANQAALAAGLPVQEQILAIAAAYREFAHAHPDPYVLAFTTSQPEMIPEPSEQERRVIEYQRILAAWCGEANSLAALRGLLALMHGYAMLEISRQFRRGGDLDSTYTAVIRAYLDGVRG